MKNKEKLRQKNVLTAIVGSYPKPKYIFPKSGRKLLDSFGFAFDKQKTAINKAAFNKLIDKAALEAILDQDEAGIDYITDGEERRGHYVLDIVKKLKGIDNKNLKRIAVRNGLLFRDAPIVKDKITYAGHILVDEFLFTKKYTKNIPKVGLPGPTTVVDCVADEYYNGDKKALAFDYATAINKEVGALIKAGCKVIQFDDPVLLRYPEDAKKWGLKALESCFTGYEDQATFIVHICRGYPNKPLEKKGINYKANKEYYKDILKWFSSSKLDAVSIEGAQSNLDLSILPAIGKKSVMLGVLDVGSNKVETVASLVNRGNEALKYLPKKQLILAPDCGMLELTRTSARKKLINLSLAAKSLNRKEDYASESRK
ncbi:MAG: hypothetical protein ACREHC_08280 [Candidatus Levyibacteriota bacterium]